MWNRVCSMAFRLISTRSPTGSVRHSPRATGRGLLRVACMVSRCRRLFFAAAPIDFPRRPILFVAAPCPGCAVHAAGTPGTERWQAVCDRCPGVSTSLHSWAARTLPEIWNASVLQDASSFQTAVRAFSAVLARLAACERFGSA